MVITNGRDRISIVPVGFVKVRERLHASQSKRMLYEDESGREWAFWHGTFRTVKRRTVNDWPSKGMQTEMFFVDGNEGMVEA